MTPRPRHRVQAAGRRAARAQATGTAVGKTGAMWAVTRTKVPLGLGLRQGLGLGQGLGCPRTVTATQCCCPLGPGAPAQSASQAGAALTWPL